MLRTDVFCMRKKVCNRPGCAIDLWDTLTSFLMLKIKCTLKILGFSLLSKSRLLLASLLALFKYLTFYNIFILFFITRL